MTLGGLRLANELLLSEPIVAGSSADAGVRIGAVKNFFSGEFQGAKESSKIELQREFIVQRYVIIGAGSMYTLHSL